MKKFSIMLIVLLSLILLACSQTETVTVHFDTMGGESLASIEITKGDTLTLPEPIKQGFTFTGWFVDEAALEEFLEDTPIEVTITLFADWERNRYTVTFETQGGSDIEPIEVLYEDAIALPNDPEKTGHTFTGWYLENEPFDLDTMPNHHLILRAGWSVNAYTITYVDLEPLQPITVTAGWYHSGLLTICGRVMMWGDNDLGQLGEGTMDYAPSPVDITDKFMLHDDEVIIELASGGSSNMALSSENRVFTWGSNTHGQLGIGSTLDQPLPTDITEQFPLSEQEVIITIRVSLSHMMVLTDSGRVFGWGRNSDGYVGDGSRIQRSSPVEITGFFFLEEDDKIVYIDIAANNVAISENGRVFTWGWNFYGQLGDGTTTDHYQPIEITDQFNLLEDEEINTIVVGDNHAAVLTSSGRVLTFGWNHFGQLGDGTKTMRKTPTDISDYITLYEEEFITQVYAGSVHTILVSNLGRMVAFGDNRSGQLGLDESVSDLNIPTNITLRFDKAFEETFIALDSYRHNIVLTSEHRIFMWGWNSYNQVVDDVTEAVYEPVLVGTVFESIFIFEDTFMYDETLELYSPFKDNQAFLGWYHDIELTTIVPYETMPADDLVLYAKWGEQADK